MNNMKLPSQAEMLMDIIKLKNENEKLKEYQESYRKEIDYWRIQFSDKEERINKAIEYIKQGDWHENDAYLGNDILSILRGEDNESN